MSHHHPGSAAGADGRPLAPVLAIGADPARVLDEVCRCLSADFDIEHSTIQLETSDRRRLEAVTHP